MCNAWNHSIHCRCGWGGEGHLGRRSADTYYGVAPHCRVPRVIDLGKDSVRWSWYRGNFDEPSNCPICGGKVYFIRHNGGSVWLDCLGPPWDKHPCFDVAPTRSRDFRYLSPSDIRYQKEINTTIQTHKMLHKSSGPSKSATLGIVVEAEGRRSGIIRVSINIKFDRTLVWYIQNSMELRDIIGSLVLVDLESYHLYFFLDGFVTKYVKEEPELAKRNSAVITKDEYVVGEKIQHCTLGIGTITAVEPVGADYKLTVQFRFPSYSTKKLMAKIAKVVKLK